MILWNYGNTTVRSPFRLRDGLILIKEKKLEGALRGKENEIRFNQMLADAGIIEHKGDETYSIGRKWRSALTQHGFLYPKSKKEKDNEIFSTMLGEPDTLTPNGLRLIEAETVPGWQEIFLRSLSAYMIPSYLKPEKYHQYSFSPLRLVLNIMIHLEKETNDSRLTFLEIASIVQCSTPQDGLETTVNRILQLRDERSSAVNKKKFDRKIYEKLAKEYGKAPGTFRDYADTNIRYLKATGLFHSKGKGIALFNEKRILIDSLAAEQCSYNNDITYLKSLTEGAVLPFDNLSGAKKVLSGLVSKLNEKGEHIKIPIDKLDSPADIAVIRHQIESKLFELNELEYAKSQASKIHEILEYIELFTTKKDKKTLANGKTIEIPKAERPAYLEWIIWRAFLAINSLRNMPWDARRFKVDQDFYPINTAPGGGPDMIFEFDNMVLVVEVTLTTSSRQEAAEGESVRRHVAQYAAQYIGTRKRVYGLFIAIDIDTNTANTFRLGEWYLNDDRKISLHIIPIKLSDFHLLLSAYSNNLHKLQDNLNDIMLECRVEINRDAPAWKQAISNIIKKWIGNY